MSCPAAEMRDGGGGDTDAGQLPTTGQGDRPVLLGGRWTEGAGMETKQNQDVTPKLSVDTEAGVTARR